MISDQYHNLERCIRIEPTCTITELADKLQLYLCEKRPFLGHLHFSTTIFHAEAQRV